MELPSEIKIGGHWWTVVFPYDFTRTDRELYADGGVVDALCDQEHKIIYISGQDNHGVERPASSVYVSFIHELLHAMDSVGCHRIWQANGQDQEQNERSIASFAEIMFQVIVDNGAGFLGKNHAQTPTPKKRRRVSSSPK